MGKKGSTNVTPVDPWEAGRADATFNRIDSYTPFGNLTYSGPNRNQANLQLNPYLAGNEERRMLSDRMLLDTALGRQQQMNQGGLPSLTSGINPGAMQNFFGLPTSLQSGFDTAPTPPRPPNVIPGSDTPGGAKGGSGSSGSSGGMKGGARSAGQGAVGAATPGGGVYGQGGSLQAKGGQPQQQPYRPGADMSVKPQQGVGDMGGQVNIGPLGQPLGGGFTGQAPPLEGPLGPSAGGGGAKGGGQMGGQLPQGIDPRAVANDPQGFQEWQRGRAAQQQSQAPGQKGGQQQNILGGTVGAAIGNPLDNVSGQRDVYNNTDFGGATRQAQNVYSGTDFGNATSRATSVLDRIDPNTFGQIGSLSQLQDFDMDRNRVEQSFFDRTSSLLNPQYDQAEQRMVSDLRARGIPRNSEAFEREMSNFRRDKGETYSRLADQAVLSGGGEQSRLFGISSALGDRPMNAANQLFGMSSDLGRLGLGAQGQAFDQASNLGMMGLGAQGQQFGQAGQLGSAQGQAQQQLFGMADALGQRDIQAQLQNANISSMNRATQFNELASLLGLQQVASPGLNNFFAPGNVDMMGAYGMNQQARMANAQNSANMKGGFMQGVGDLAGAAIGAPTGRPWFLGG